MATILYKKFFKKTPKDPTEPKQQRLCIHQRTSDDTSDAVVELSSFPGSSIDNPDSREKVTTSNVEGQRVSGFETPCDICKQDKKSMRRYRRKLIFGLFLPFMVQGLDTTIIASALPFIASDFSKFSKINISERHLY
jgi:hypothetical protein